MTRCVPVGWWRSIHKVEPFEGQRVLIYGVGCKGPFMVDALWEDSTAVMYDPVIDAYNVECTEFTHWMPLPDPPE